MRRLALAALFLCGCGRAFTPDSVVNSFRVLGVKADLPELHPGDFTPLHALVVDPTRPTKPNTLVWISCDPDPLDLGRSACSDLGNLQSASALASEVDGGTFVLPPGMHTIGYNDSAVDYPAGYLAPVDTFALIPTGDPRRQVGSLADMLIIAAAGDLPLTAPDAQKSAFFTAVQNAQIPAVLVIDRVVISEETTLNHNPVLGDLLVNGTALPDGGTFRFLPGDSPTVEQTAPDSSFETFVETQPDGTVSTQQETLIAAYYSTTGAFSLDRVALRSGTPLTFAAPDGGADAPIPDKRTGMMWVVVRDTRGGTNWNEYPVFVCDPGLPAPAVTAINPPSGSANGTTRLGVTGQNLQSILDVLVGGVALRGGAYSPVVQDFDGLVPMLPSGDYPVTVRGKDCQDYDPKLAYHVP